ncbi:MAG: ribosome-associated translation inhibitor RaiA [Pseudoflavonifractor capillosus]|uniref:ribosome hibernation-promoting factor, HPF/YfiA family n=1 Tax=Pseudoflavonifractor capillosus TaxID=106588 RepID=UPI0023F6A627|nr:ribosome-associated translation inhibitor RaiA [Pseudoflavonifractor capillosus]MCI5927187.1 ribosome-associated translation inhibitor RaiA [Pseudoflavonifractor capillosus]
MKFAFIDKKSPQPEKVLAYAEKKVGKLDRYFHDDAEATVRFQEKKRGQVKIEVTVRTGSSIFRAESYSDSMFSAIDAAVDTIEGQIRKNKTRLAKRLKKDAFAELAAPAGEESEDSLQVVRAKRFALSPMGVEEAILQMNLLGHTFFAFRNEDEQGAFSVVYAREDGGYGLIVDQQ